MIKFEKKHIPNYISVFRLLLIPVFVYLYFLRRDITRAAAVFVLAGISDVVDGFLARHNNWITNLGKILDPVADKCMQATVLISLSIDDIVPWWISAILIGKELLMILGATRLMKKFNIYVQSGWWGKAAVVFFYAVVVVLMLVKTLTHTTQVVLSSFLIVSMLFALIMYYVKIYRKKSQNVHEPVLK